jgi:hypothetical protein
MTCRQQIIMNRPVNSPALADLFDFFEFRAGGFF